MISGPDFLSVSQSMPVSGYGGRPRVLVVDDDASIREVITEFLELEGYFVAAATDGADALSMLAEGTFDLVLTDMKMPRMGGIELLAEVQRRAPTTMTVIMTGFGTVETAIHAMKDGAYDYILKPFRLDEVLLVVSRAIEARRAELENIKLRQALSIYQVSEALSHSLSLEDVVDALLASCFDEMTADYAAVYLVDQEGQLYPRERRCSESLQRQAVDLGEVLPRLVDERLNGSIPLIVRGHEAKRFFARDDLPPLSTFMAVALVAQGRRVGFIAVATCAESEALGEGDRKLLSIVASRAAAAIENARLYSDLQATFQQTIEGLARAVDKMDRYTAGHSERVADYAVHLGKRLGLDDSKLEILRLSALMHDIGKIGCVLNLNKSGKLTDDEYEAFKEHPVYGRDILQPIKFLHPIVPGVYSHHERFDGRGYPLGLAGEDIPLLARIISVADTYDAMTSNRSYRRALPNEVAIAEIERCSGGQFDPDVAAEFVDTIDDFHEECQDVGDTPRG